MADQYFPPEIIYAILSRMPIKSLARFRCVCKLWLKYIDDPYLLTIHIEEEPTPIMFQRFEPHYAPSKSLCKITFLGEIQGTSTVKQEPVMKMWHRGSYYCMSRNIVLGSCNGLTLVCYEQNPRDGIFFAVTNPLTKQYYDLPPAKTGPWHCLSAAGIGFDESTNTLKTVYVIYSQGIIRTFVHKPGMRSWREIEQKLVYPISDEGVFVHGRLHWLASLDEDLWPPNYKGRKIVWFEVKLEEFGLLDPPKEDFTRKGGLRDYYRKQDHVVNLNSEVGYALFNSYSCELWILKQEEWVLHCCFKTTLNKRYLDCDIVVSGFLNKNGDILFTTYGGKILFIYTLNTGDLRQANRGDLRPVNRDLRQVNHNDPLLAHEADIRMYQSSLFSIRGVNTSAYSVSNQSRR